MGELSHFLDPNGLEHHIADKVYKSLGVEARVAHRHRFLSTGYNVNNNLKQHTTCDFRKQQMCTLSQTYAIVQTGLHVVLNHLLELILLEQVDDAGEQKQRLTRGREGQDATTVQCASS